MATNLVKRAQDRLEAARSARFSREGRWAVALAFVDGRQYVKWNESTTSLVPAVSGAERAELGTFDLMRPYLLYLVARATMNHPDVQVDNGLAKVVLDHYDAKNKLQELVKRMAFYNVTATTGFWTIRWNPKAKAKVRMLDEETGEQSVGETNVGDIEEGWIPGHEMYFWPPTASTWDEVKTFIHVSLQPTEDLEAQYPKLRGKDSKLKRGISTWARGFWTLVQAAFGTGEKGQQAVVPEGMEIVLTCHDAPTDTAPGKCYVLVGEQLVYEKDLDGPVPIVPLQYGDHPLSPWGEGPGFVMTASQMAINRLVSKYIRRILHIKTTVFGRQGDGAGRDMADQFKTGTTRVGENLETRIVKVGLDSPIPTLAADPVLGAEFIQAFDKLVEIMRQQCGVHDPAIAMGSGESGVALRLRLDADQTQTAPYLRSIEQFLVRRAEMILRYAKRYSTKNEFRWYGPDDTGVASDLSEMAQVPSVTIESGSATLLSPTAQEEQAREILATMPEDAMQQLVWAELLTCGPGSLVKAALQRAHEKQSAMKPEEGEEPLTEEAIEDPGEEEYAEDPGEIDDIRGAYPEGQGYL